MPARFELGGRGFSRRDRAFGRQTLLPDQVGISATGNADAVSIGQDILGSLPMLDQNYVATLSRFLDVGAIGTGGPTIVVNGMEVSSLNVTPSAVQQIKINQDPYSAEYSRPDHGVRS